MNKQEYRAPPEAIGLLENHAAKAENDRTMNRTWILVMCCIGVVVALSVQWRTISELHNQVADLRAERQTQMTNQARTANAPEVPSVELQQLRKDKTELLQLRNEVRDLREQVSRYAAERSLDTSQPANEMVTEDPYHNDEVQQLGAAIRRGDAGALDRLAKLALALPGTNSNEAVLSEIRLVFKALGAEAGQGNAAALQAIWQASRLQGLKGYAVAALGQAAAQGNEEALEPLLNPTDYLILRSSAVSALRPAADSGNARAIQALVAVAADQDQRPLWFMAAQGLESAAVAGDSAAIDALASLAAAENRNVNRQAVLALEAAARGQQPRAEEALRKLGWR